VAEAAVAEAAVAEAAALIDDTADDELARCLKRAAMPLTVAEVPRPRLR
jgi:hypothetical protein